MPVLDCRVFFLDPIYTCVPFSFTYSITCQNNTIGGNRVPASQTTAHFIPVIQTSGLVHCSKRRRYILLILAVIPFRMYTVSKLNKQNEQTWVNLQRQLNSVQFPYSKALHEQRSTLFCSI